MVARQDSIEIDLEPLGTTGEHETHRLERFAGYEVLGRQAVVGRMEILVVRDPSASGRGRLLTVRAMRPSAAEDETFAQTFSRDARVALRLEHPNLGKAHRAGVEAGIPFVALELVHGASVRELIERARDRGEVLVPAIAGAIALTVADAMHAVHLARARANDIRPGPRQDVDPADVMIALDGTVKLLATPLDAETDVFALGLMLHEMLTGRRPSARALDAQPRLWPRAVPARLARVLDRALADDPSERYASAAAMRDDLLRWLADEREDISRERIAAALPTTGAPLERPAFTPLRAHDATAAHVLARREERHRRGVVLLLLLLLVAALLVASAGVLAP